jgi:hypothetical protein
MWDENYMVQGINEFDPAISTYSPQYPTTTTNKVGHYVYFNAQGDASSAFLNCSNYLGGVTGGTGGFQFHQASCVLKPTKLAHITTNGLQIPKDNRTTIYLTENVISSGPNYIIFAYNPSGPPTNWVRGNMYVIQVGNAGTVLQPNTNYNVQYIDTQEVQVHTTSDPASPLIDSSGITTTVLFPIGTTGSINTAQLSSTDLTFNSVSITSQIRDLQIKQISTINQNISAAIYADGRPPTAPTSTIINTYAYSPSWYFKNTVAGYKINWYLAAPAGLTVGDILGLYIDFFNGNNSNNSNTPFITVYTTPTGSGDYAPNFYHSANTYIFDGSITANTRYTEFLNLSSCPTPNTYATTLRNMIPTPVNNPRGTYASTETVEFFSIGTNSIAAVNTLEIAVSKFGIMLSSGTTEINFFPV